MNKDIYNNFLQEIKNGTMLGYVPKEYRTYELCLEAVKHYGLSLCMVPQEYRDYELCLEAVKQYGFALIYVPEEIKDYNMCIKAVNENAFSLDNVPEKYKSYNLCLHAVRQNGRVLKYIPSKYRDYNMCLEAIKQIGSNNYFRQIFKTKDENNVEIRTIIHDKWVLNYIPNKYINKILEELNLDELYIEELQCVA